MPDPLVGQETPHESPYWKVSVLLEINASKQF